MGESVGCPGIHGSLGQCAVCGENFLTEIVFNESVDSFTIPQSDQTLYAHKDCLNRMEKMSEQNKTMLDLPEKSPLRKAAEKMQRKAQNDPSN